jgi:hypothetical protein
MDSEKRESTYQLSNEEAVGLKVKVGVIVGSLQQVKRCDGSFHPSPIFVVVIS